MAFILAPRRAAVARPKVPPETPRLYSPSVATILLVNAPWLGTALTVGAIAVVAGLAFILSRRAIGIAVRELLERREAVEADLAPMTAVELERRIRTLQRLAVRIVGGLIVLIAALMALGEFEVDIGPAIAGLGVAGIAVGFGAQALVKDWLAGVFIVLENQYSQGDVVQIAGVDGVVEEFSLRRTVLRDLSGTVHSVPNGQIAVASNLSRGWARVNLDVSVAYDTDIDQASALINRVGEELSADPAWADRILQAPVALRVNSFDDSAVTLKVLGQVRPAEQWAVSGELRKRLLAAFAAEGVEIPYPHRVMISRPGPSDGE
jgi:small-conductance mechanosensitive channel